MFILITGGSGSGKSEFAEETIQNRFEPPYFYLATMQPFGEETLRKIERHQKLRKDKGFDTLECYFYVADAAVSKDATVLLECISNLTANIQFGEMEMKTGKKKEKNQREKIQIKNRILFQIQELASKVKNLVVVTNEVCSDGLEQYEAETKEYMDILGSVNQGLVCMADEVYEVVYGIPIQIKGLACYSENILQQVGEK